MNILQISSISIIAVLLAIQFKNVKNEYVILIMIAAALIIFSVCISKIAQVINVIDKISSEYGFSKEYIELLIKIVGITYLCEFSSDICKDNGFVTLSNQIHIFGKLSVLILGIPVFVQLLDVISVLV